MKKLCIFFLLLFIILVTIFAFKGGDETEFYQGDYLRIHIRANSNESDDQSVKMLVKDALVEFLSETVAHSKTKEESMINIRSKFPEMERLSKNVLASVGFSYGAKVSLKREEFPTRVYDGVTLPAGSYDAIIVELGEAKGDNWWCVVYPPLCFTDSEGIVYKSLIREIIEDFFT